MILRFDLVAADYDEGIPTLQNPVVTIDYTDISGSVEINGVCNLSFTDLGSGTFITSGLPCVAGDATVNSVTLVNGLFITIDIDVPHLWTDTDIRITLNKDLYMPLVRDFVVFGYDIGKNLNVPITTINPELQLVMIPESYPVDYATTGTVLTTGSLWDTSTGFGEAVLITADYPGVAGNGITIIGDGSTYFSTLIANWNAANPTNTIAFLEINGNGYRPELNETFTLAGGTNLPIANVAYASFSTWRKPFTNDLYAFATYSNLRDIAEYRDAKLQPYNVLGDTHTIMLPCENDKLLLETSTYNVTPCGGIQIVDSATTTLVTISSLILIPTFSCGTTSVSSCTDDCLVTIDDNYTQFILDVTTITPLNVDDVEVVSTDEVTIKTAVYDACGNLLNSDSALVSINPVPVLSGTQIPIIFPEEGDYIIECEVYTDAYTCKKVETFKGCTFYKMEKSECNNHTITNLSLDAITVSVEVLNKDKGWDVFLAEFTIDACGNFLIETTSDGVYRVTVNGEEYRVFIQDCNMKLCFIDYVKARVCNPAADCACGGNCGGLCVTVPKDLYDFNAFSILTYNYMALLNDLYLKNFIFTVFQPSDLDRLFSIHQYLLRIEEYCGKCNTVVVATNSGSCGCN